MTKQERLQVLYEKQAKLEDWAESFDNSPSHSLTISELNRVNAEIRMLKEVD